jgi:T3SS negative regulator,GrlR
LLNGLYKVEYGVNDAFGRSIMCMHNGKLLGGNSAFAHLGTYQEIGGEIVGEVITQRHNDDPHYKPLMDTDVAAISVRGQLKGNNIRFEGSAAPRPGALFWANLTRLDDEALPPVGIVGPGGITNGLYSLQLRALDGVEAGLSGVMLLLDGRILGGDAFFYYLGSYASADGRWKGEILNQEHTPAKGENPVFGGHEVGIGFTGTCDEAGAELEAIALAGKRSLRLAATLKLMRPV